MSEIFVVERVLAGPFFGERVLAESVLRLERIEVSQREIGKRIRLLIFHIIVFALVSALYAGQSRRRREACWLRLHRLPTRSATIAKLAGIRA